MAIHATITTPRQFSSAKADAATSTPGPRPLVVATTFETANPPGGNLTGRHSPWRAGLFFVSVSLNANPSGAVSRLADIRSKKNCHSFTPTARDHLCRAYCCCGQAAHHNQYQNDFHGGFSMRNALVQAVLDVTAVVVGLLFLVALASSIPLAVFIMFFASY